MINLFRFLLRNSSFFLFIFFEIVALYLVVKYNRTQQSIFIQSSNQITGILLEKYDKVDDYFHLQEINHSLNKENSALLRKIEKLKRESFDSKDKSYDYIPAKVITNKIDGRYNRFTINKGASEGIRRGMGILYNEIPVGIVYQVTSNYASAISLLNVNLNLSAEIKDKGYFGTLAWLPTNPREGVINHIPVYADVVVGDSVVTSGYSQVFPEDLYMGIVEAVITPKGKNSYEIMVRLFADIGRMDFVQIVENLNQQELDSLTIKTE
jgi:rod shape-determining protein MreC